MDKNNNNKKTPARKTEQTPYTYSFWSVFSNTFGIIFKIFIVVILTVGVVMGGLGLGMVIGWIQTAEPITPEQLEINTNLTTFIYDSEENVVAKLTGSDNINREQVGYDGIPRILEHAIVAIEDERFYEHRGFDVIRIFSSVYSLIINKGEITQGGSTLTQQVYKNYTGRFEQTFERKFQELYNSILLEMRYDKKTIIEAYANIVNMGNGCYGFQSASKLYFGKDLKDVTLAEAAFLAGIPNEPTTYNPYTEKGYKLTRDRMKNILDKMLELGFIDEETHEETRDIRVEIKTRDNTVQPTSIHSYFVDQVIRDAIDEIANKVGVTKILAENWIYNNGYHIFTTLDPKLQSAMDEVFMDPSFFPTTDKEGNVLNRNAQKYGELPQAGMVIIDQYSGQIKAMYGGNGEKTGNMTYNRATSSFRQPGSSFKPLAVYGPALELELITAATVVDDVPSYLDPKNPEEIYPTNYDSDHYTGLVTVRNAIKSSINVVAAKVWSQYLGRDNSVYFLDKMGIDRGDYIYDDTTVSVATGGLELGVNPYLMANAFATFANKGVYIPAHTITEIKNHRDETIFKMNPGYDTVYREQTAYIMTDILQEVTKSATSHYQHIGTAFNRINIQDRAMPVAGKTGTTSDYLDKWFVGYTPYYTAAVWYGYDNRISPIKLVRGTIETAEGDTTSAGEYELAQIIWNAVMEKVHEDLEPVEFERPLTGIVERQICIYSGKTPTDLCRQDPRYTWVRDATMTELFLEGTEPSHFDTCDVHQTATICTASTDPYGRYLLANEYCPPETTMEIIGIVRPVPYIPSLNPDPEDRYLRTDDMAIEIPVGEYCTVHGLPSNEDETIITEPVEDEEDAD